MLAERNHFCRIAPKATPSPNRSLQDAICYRDITCKLQEIFRGLASRVFVLNFYRLGFMALTETGQVWHEARFLFAKTKSVEMVLMTKLISQPNGTEARGRTRFQPVEWIETGPLTLKVKERREPACESKLE